MQVQERGPDAVAKSFDLRIQSQNGATDFHGLQVLRRYEEPNRSVHVRVSKLLLPTEGLQLCGNAWTVISTSSATGGCNVRFYLQLFVETQKGFAAEAKDVKFLQEEVLDSWSLKLRSHWQWQQELVADNLGIHEG